MLPKLFYVVRYRVDDTDTPITLDGDPGGDGKPDPSDLGS